MGFLIEGTVTNLCGSKLYEMYPRSDGSMHVLMPENYVNALMAMHTGKTVAVIYDGCNGSRAKIISIHAHAY